MRQGTTPTHTFRLPCPAADVKDARITYASNGSIVLEKKLSHCKVEGTALILTLTQRETFKFHAMTAFVQIRILTKDNKVYGSDKIPFNVLPSMNKEILE